ncbi:MAG: YbhB/YbcL family Raf kinase inhibitor-like protein [Alphaproteobacteria bacterium]|nr:YbhB/YbcL family Raf kinase inhibitor-like protein [Alphaproteobacteria bacterium]
MPFRLTSPDFKDGDYLGQDQILSAVYGFGCAGGNRSPRLAWEDPPAGTESFTLTVYDPDAPTGSGFWHWLVCNLPANCRALPGGIGMGGALPAGAIETRTDFGKPGYGGPCPPPGDHPHRYLFALYAVKGKVNVTADTPAAQVGFQLHFATLAKATLMGLYKRA